MRDSWKRLGEGRSTSEVACSCDIRIASERSRFGTPEINLGLIPGYGATQRLVKLLGYGKAMELIMTGEMVDANEANRICGLIRKWTGYEDVIIQYGGSVKSNNIDEIMSMSDIDGVLVGGASLDPINFARIANYETI